MTGKKCVSIDIGEKNIHVLEGAYKAGLVEIDKAVSLDTPAGSVTDGRLDDGPAIRDQLRNVLKRSKIRSKNVIFSVQSTSIITRDFTMPFMNADSLSSAADYEMEQYIPASMDQYTVEHKLTGEANEGDVKKWRIRSAAVPRELVAGYYKLAGELRLKPLALDLHLNSISKLFMKSFIVNREKFDPERTYALVDLGYRYTGVHIIANRKLEFSRLISFGGRDLDVAVAMDFELDFGRAEQKKKELRLEDKDTMLNRQLQKLLAEVQTVLHYYAGRGGGGSMQTVFLYGGGAALKGLDDFTEQFLNVRCVAVNELDTARLSKNVGVRDIGGCLNAAGALIRL